MKYSITATLRTGELSRFWLLLNNGTINSQEPDGNEIVASMKRAVVSMKRAVVSGDKVTWNETCYCNPPLQHERSTVYDQFFWDMHIEPAAGQGPVQGQRFWDYLRDHSDEGTGTTFGSPSSTRVKYVPIRIL